jgi:hypothetical protein
MLAGLAGLITGIAAMARGALVFLREGDMKRMEPWHTLRASIMWAVIGTTITSIVSIDMLMKMIIADDYVLIAVTLLAVALHFGIIAAAICAPAPRPMAGTALVQGRRFSILRHGRRRGAATPVHSRV